MYAGYFELYKYNGNTWDSMGIPEANGEKLRVCDILETADGKIYIGTMSPNIFGGTGIWEHRAGKWVKISGGISDKPFGVSYFNYERSSFITCLLEDKNGNIYAGTDGGVWKYNGGESWSCISTSLPSSSNYIASLTEGVDGNIYDCRQLYKGWRHLEI